MTPSSNDTLERIARRIPIPEPAYERMLRRRDRTRRNQRSTAGVVGIAVFVAAVWIVTSGRPTDRTQRPANEPSVSPAEDVVRGFLAAFGAFDPEAAMTYVADDADLSGLIDLPAPANEKGLSLELALLKAQGVQLTITSCQTSPFGSATSVICGFDFHSIASDVLGGGPLTGSMFVFTVRDGEIVKAAGNQYDLQTAERLYATFAEWAYATYPRDFQVMYKTGRYVLPRPEGFRHVYVPRLTGESIRLWEKHTREYVEARSAETGPAEAAVQPASDITIDGPFGVGCSAGARARLVLTDIGDRIAVRFEVHRSPVGHSWHIVLIHDEADTGGGGFHWRLSPFFEGTRVASDSGDLVVQAGSVVDQEWVDGFRAEATDRQTGQVCRRFARGGSASI
jgi:hypothetical protein